MSAASILVVLLVPLCIVLAIMDRNMGRVRVDTGPVVQRVAKDLHSTREGYNKVERIYVIAGGSGFIGAWLVRYLLLREEKSIYILDRIRPPSDILRHGATFIDVELTNGPAVESNLAKIALKCDEATRVIVYNCSVSRSYWSVGPLKNLQAAETLCVNVGNLMPPRRVVLIHIGDSMAYRKPVQWYKWWKKQGWFQQTPDDTLPILPFSLGDRLQAFSSYAWSQGAVETLTRSLPEIYAATLRVDGFVSGHADDNWLGPALEHGGGILHSWGAPISLVHVEDVVRAALALEFSLLDPETRDDRRGTVFTIGSNEVTSLDRIYEYVREKQPYFHIISVSPIIAYLVGYLVSFVSVISRWNPLPQKEKGQSILRGSPYTLTLARFSTLQIGQLPNHINTKRLMEELNFQPNFTLSQTLDGVIYETVKKLEQNSVH